MINNLFLTQNFINIGETIVNKIIIKNCLDVLGACAKSYGYCKFMEKTGMTMAECLLYKDMLKTFKPVNKAYMKHCIKSSLSIFSHAK